MAACRAAVQSSKHRARSPTKLNIFTPLLYTSSVHGERAWKVAKPLWSNDAFESLCVQLLAPCGYECMRRHDRFKASSGNAHGLGYNWPELPFSSGGSSFLNALPSHKSLAQDSEGPLPAALTWDRMVGRARMLLKEAGGFVLPAAAFVGSKQLQVFLDHLEEVS